MMTSSFQRQQRAEPHPPRHRHVVPLHEGSPLVGRSPPPPSMMAEEDETDGGDTAAETDSHDDRGQPSAMSSSSSPSKAKAKGPSLMHHFSMDWALATSPQQQLPRAAPTATVLRPSSWSPSAFRRYAAPFAILTLVVILAWSGRRRGMTLSRFPSHQIDLVVPIQHAHEAMLDLGDGDGQGLRMWYRTWGNRRSGVPVLFVHGGPGNAIEDYGYFNAEFFAADTYFVVEPDQRGTGRSQPSVRESCDSMQYYRNISIAQMSSDFELLRGALGIDQWLVFGGSWGSTLSLDYAERYPSRTLGLILRGVYLNTREEFTDVFARRSYLHNPKRLAEFDAWHAVAAKEAVASGEEALDPNDAERFYRIYERLIERCDRDAIWRYHVFENNLMEEDASKLLDPETIVAAKYPEAQSVAFFEARLFLRGTFDDPVDLLGRVPHLQHSPPQSNRPRGSVRAWICQGHRDEVCPEKYAQKLADALEDAGVPTAPRFIDAGHECTDPIMKECLRESLAHFLERGS